MVQLNAANYTFADPTSSGHIGEIEAIAQNQQRSRMLNAEMALRQARDRREQGAYEDALRTAAEQSKAQIQAGQMLAAQPSPDIGNLSLSNEDNRAQQWQHLQGFQQQQMQQAGTILGHLDPRYAQRFQSDLRTSFADQALTLHRSHTVDRIHDGIVSGKYDPPDPETGQRVPDEAIRGQVADIGERVKSGELDPQQAQAMVDEIAALNTKAHVEITKRKTTAAAASAKLNERMAQGLPVSSWSLAAVHDLNTREGAMKEWGDIAPYVMAGMTPDPLGGRGFVTEEHAAKILEKYAATIAQIQTNTDVAADKPALAREAIQSRERQTLGTLQSRESEGEKNRQQRGAEAAMRENTRDRGISMRGEAARNAAQAERVSKDEQLLQDATKNIDLKFPNMELGAERDAAIQKEWQRLKVQAPSAPASKATPEQQARIDALRAKAK